MTNFSIIIPTLNEEDVLASTIEHLIQFNTVAEIIIADGGSSDSTLEIAEKYNLKVAYSLPGRGAQLNAGVKESTGEIIIFLHADTFLPQTAFEDISNMFSDPDIVISTFKLKFDRSNPVLSFYSYFSKFDSIFSTFGDQAIVVRKQFLQKLGGFKEYKLFEDVEFLQRARKYTRIKKMKSYVVTSARRFNRNGILKTQFVNLWYILRYLTKGNTEEIYNRYFLKSFNKNITSVILFLKLPEKTKVKTRLASTTNNEFAVEFYKLCVQSLLSGLKKLDKSKYHIHIFFENENNQYKVAEWLGSSYTYVSQKGNDLGQKMYNAFNHVFTNGYKQAIILGSDIPDMDSKDVVEAKELLNNCDVVISPSPDGGYNLIALKVVKPELFEKISWSTDKVFSQTIANIDGLNLTYKLTETLIDIDDENDLLNWMKNGENRQLIDQIKYIYNNELLK